MQKEKVQAIQEVRESLAELQKCDSDIGPIVPLRLESDVRSELSDLLAASETAKRLYNEWQRLHVRDRLVYRWGDGKPGEQPVLLLLFPHSHVQCHGGHTGGHFGIKRTLDQVKRRFYWSSWKSDTVRFCNQSMNQSQGMRTSRPQVSMFGVYPVVSLRLAR